MACPAPYSGRMTRLTSFSFSPLLWLCAFICALFPINEYQLHFMAAAVLLLLVWAYDRLSRGLKQGLVVSHQPLILVMALFWLLSLCSVAWSGVVWVSILSFFFMGALPITFLVLALHPFSQQEWRVITGGLMGIMAVLSIWAMLQFFVFYEYFFGRAKHPLADPNSLAALFNLALFCILGAMTWMDRRRDKIVMLVLSISVFGGMMATGSRGGFFALILGLVLTLWLCRDAVWQARRYWLAFLVGMAVLFTLSLTGPDVTSNMASRVGSIVGVGDEAPHDNRLSTMQAAWQIVKAHWLTGTGIGTFFLYYPEHRSMYEVDLLTHAHNDPLQFWTEMGVFAPLLFYGFIILAIMLTLKCSKSLPAADPARLKLIFPFIALTVLIAHSHINLNLYNLSILLLAGLTLTYWYQQTGWQGKSSLIAYGKTKQAALAVFFAAAMAIYVPMIVSEHFAARARDAIFAGDLARYGDNILLADKFGLQGNYNVYLLAVNIPMSILYQLAGDMDVADQRKQAEQINSNLDEVLTRNPRSAAAWYYKGVLAQLVKPEAIPDGVPSPEESFERAIKIDPIHLGARLALIDMALEKNNVETAHALVDGGIRFRYHTSTAQSFFTKALIVASLSHDKEMQKLAHKGIYEYTAQDRDTLVRKRHNPLAWLAAKDELAKEEAKATGFPQGVDSPPE